MNENLYREWLNSLSDKVPIRLDYKDIRNINFDGIDTNIILNIFDAIDSMKFFIKDYIPSENIDFQKKYISDVKKAIAIQEILHHNTKLIEKNLSSNNIEKIYFNEEFTSTGEPLIVDNSCMMGNKYNIHNLFLYDLYSIGKNHYKNNKEIQKLILSLRVHVPFPIGIFLKKSEDYFSKLRPYEHIEETYRNVYFQNEISNKDIIKTGAVNIFLLLSDYRHKLSLTNDILNKIFDEDIKNEQYFKKNISFEMIRINSKVLISDKDKLDSNNIRHFKGDKKIIYHIGWKSKNQL